MRFIRRWPYTILSVLLLIGVLAWLITGHHGNQEWHWWVFPALFATYYSSHWLYDIQKRARARREKERSGGSA